MNIKTKRGIRKGQELFNFLEWLHTEKGYRSVPRKIADTFHIQDEELGKLWKEYNKKY